LQTALSIRPTVLAQVPTGIDPVREALKVMRELVLAGKMSPNVRKLAEDLVKLLPNRAKLLEIAACFDHVRENTRYLSDPTDVEMLHTADAVDDIGQSDCDGQAVLLASLLESIGKHTRFVAVGFKRPREYSHVFCQTVWGAPGPRWSDGWLTLDTIVDYPMGWTPPGIVGPPMIIHNRR
jgi:transglutaminase-like putative cysteine protease